MVDSRLYVRRMNVTACNVISEDEATKKRENRQLSLFEDFDEPENIDKKKQSLAKERGMQEAMLKIKGKYGKNAILKGMNLEEGGTAITRNGQIGGHKA